MSPVISTNRKKQIEYFKSKTASELKQNFYKFYSSHIKINSDKTTTDLIEVIINDDSIANNPKDIANSFNTFFTTLSSNSTSTKDNSLNYITKTFNNLKTTNNLLSTPKELFSYQLTTTETVSSYIKDMNTSSGPGISGIPTKVIKACVETLSSVLAVLFNAAITSATIPKEWKSAVITYTFI